ncbi:MAG TPA: hypothetical protein VK827_07275 [Lysobacter sp.]|nr:hypothetical protein [Lysobacter sp.]
MKTTRTRNMLAAALATALLSPLAWAQSDNAAGNAAAQAQQVPRPASPPPVAPRLPVDAADQVTTATDQQRLEEPMTSHPPQQSQASERAAEQSAVAQRDVWSELDVDSDGRISATEAGADAEFNAHFSMMDSNGDGFLSADEYRAQKRMVQGDDMPPAPPAQSQGAQNAAAHSSVVQREAWSRLDTDGDGRISSVEASMDPEFSTHLSTMDADDDGFVTDAEYRAFAQATGDDAYRTSGDANIDEEAGVDEQESDEQESIEDTEEKSDDDRDE